MPLDAEGLAEIVAQAIELATAPLLARIASLEQTKSLAPRDGRDGLSIQGPAGPDGEKGGHGDIGPQGERGADGVDGKDADLEVVKAFIEATVAKHVAALPTPKDGRAGADGAKGKDGRDVDTAVVDAMVAAQVERAVKAIQAPKDGERGPAGKDGTSVTVADVLPSIQSEVTKAMALLPVPKDGKDGKDGTSVTLSDVFPGMHATVAKAVAEIPKPRDGAAGRSIDPAEVESMVAKRVDVVVSALPKPQDGRSVTVEDVRPVIEAAVEKAVSARPVPKDGVGVKASFVNRDGELVLTLTDGTTQALGRVVGHDGAKGDVGPSGRDGTIDDAELVQVSDRVFRLKRADGTFIKGEFKAELVLFRGAFQDGKAYETGDIVVRRGSSWVALEPNAHSPENGGKSWALVAQRGRDGTKGDHGKDGSEGPPGRDLTQLLSDGTKY